MALIAFLGILGGAGAILFFWRPDSVAPPQTGMSERAPADGPAAPVRQPPIADNLPRKEEPGATEAAGDESSTPSVPVCEVTITFVDETGSLLPNFRFLWADVDRELRARLLNDGIDDWTPELPGQADMEGEWRVTARRLNRIAIRPESGGLHFLGRSVDEFGDRLAERNIACVAVPGGDEPEASVQLRWGQSVVVYVTCSYEDGVAYDGPATWVLRETREDVPTRVFDRGEHVSFLEPLAVSGPIGAELGIHVWTDRVGFNTRASLDVAFSASENQATHHLVIPADPNRTEITTIEVDCRAIPEGAKVELAILNRAGQKIDALEVPSPPGIIRSHDLTGGGTEFIVNLSGDCSWNSGVIFLQRGESTTVVVKLEGRGSVRARVLDTDGNPPRPARIGLEAGMGGGWFRIGPSDGKSYDGLYASSATDGVATLLDAVAGRQRILVAALGYKAQTFEVVIVPDQLVDLGDIKLEKETSGVTFALKVPEGQKFGSYYASVNLPGGTSYSKARPHFDDQGNVTFEGVSPGRYSVFVTQGSGQGGWSKWFEVEDGKITEVEVDATLPKGLQK